jgi:hypothetical protein
MAKRVHLDVELPDEPFAQLRKEEIETKVKEACHGTTERTPAFPGQSG